ncbi:MAG TPA: ROK family transcriptional regulator [Clostridiaceae bacterium]|nr:ROK family transcriptional regulator [Clostridiaceae bacterium]
MLKLGKGKKEEKQAANQQLIKKTNLTLIFNLINKYGSISRAELAHVTGLSPTTVSSLAEELIRHDIIFETGEGNTTTSGRKPIMLEVNPNGGYISSIEINEKGYVFSLYNLKCNLVIEKKIEITEYNKIGFLIIRTIEETLLELKIPEEKLFGICLGVPGLIDIVNNRITTSTIVPIDENNDFYEHIKNRFDGITIFLGNESWFSAYAEKEFGTDVNVNNLVFIDINTGVGAGIIVDGKIFTGSQGLAGEIGHMTIDMNGPLCKCGNRGCLETMISIPAIAESIISKTGYESSSKSSPYISITDDCTKSSSQIDFIQKAYYGNNSIAREVVDLAAKRLAFGITNIVNFINPEIVVIGGEITKLGEEFLEKIKYYMKDIQLKPNRGKVELKYSTLKGNTVTLGGAKYILDNILNPGILLHTYQ